MKTGIYILLLSMIGLDAFAQIFGGNARKGGYQTTGGTAVRAVIKGSDTILTVNLNPVTISSERVFKNKKQAEIYWKIKRDVKKVYPYAILAEAKLKEYNAKLATMNNEEEKKRFMKKAEKELKDQFEDELKGLTVNQGKILIKLIDRQTGSTSYELVKTLRGSFSAFMWQSLASLFGSSLKSEYDAKDKDKLIEDVIHLIESGEI
jgi:hypothetical protein